MTTMKQIIQQRIANFKLQASEKTLQDLYLVAQQIYMQNPNEDRNNVADATLYLSNMLNSQYSHYKVRQIVDSLQVIPLFVTMDCYRFHALDELDQYMRTIMQKHTQQNVITLFDTIKKQNTGLKTKDSILQIFKECIMKGEAKYIAYIEKNKITQYNQFQKLVQQILLQQIKENQLLGSIFT
ncbi:Hypothetical_protein [Hexamita inflata]|uniref:Hypothetical_protein n=1 Tax=Hexamita inflata TaxID=28002 RepID=A0AA86UW14_9EUKA|nr:Hypothetical protein HINF_LOCUS54616 [Hexamita inflata]